MRLVGPLIMAVAALASGPGAAAQTSGDPLASADATVSALRHKADAASGAYFAALDQVRTLNAKVADLEALLPKLRDAATARLRAALRRAVAAYEGGSGGQIGTVIGSSDLLTAARRARWLEALNAADNRLLSSLHQATDRLHAEDQALHSAQQQQAATVANLDAQGKAIDSELQAAVARQQQLQAQAAAARARAASASSTPAGPTTSPVPTPGYQPTPGTNPHHDDPFLTCIRHYESSGDYTVVNQSSGAAGAYQFLPPTWRSTANHAGRLDLILVPPQQASPYDQDEMGWDLYQWQGKGPWTGDPC